MHDGHNTMTIDRWPLASGAKNKGLFGKGLKNGNIFRKKKVGNWHYFLVENPIQAPKTPNQ